MDIAEAVKSTMIEVLGNIQIETTAEPQIEIPDELSDDLLLSDLNMDSISWATVIVRLEEELGVDPFDTMDDYELPTTVGDFIRFYLNTDGGEGTPTDAV